MKHNDGGNGAPGRAIILDGSRADDREAKIASGVMHAELERYGIGYVHYHLRDIQIAPCTGCMGCWTRTPGDCVIDDGQRDVYRDMARSDNVILITPVTFGGYSSDLKKAMDRLIPVLMPFFRKYRGETHHPSRYGKQWNLFGVGTAPTSDAEKEESFREIVLRNSLNMHSPKTGSVVILEGSNENDIGAKVIGGIRAVIL